MHGRATRATALQFARRRNPNSGGEMMPVIVHLLPIVRRIVGGLPLFCDLCFVTDEIFKENKCRFPYPRALFLHRQNRAHWINRNRWGLSTALKWHMGPQSLGQNISTPMKPHRSW